MLLLRRTGRASRPRNPDQPGRHRHAVERRPGMRPMQLRKGCAHAGRVG
ncbi:hypothetical protein CPT_Shaeky_036 [Streptomyces phage Shaeky]|uniref:Uncharacterized protein n=1 Tax=Streptomyces phage Shaeky TaxID=2767586 RepID=A0A873WHA8_9CAUD|nr:hypothetical protein CPT_Shaeky_036 [Streptomyces phage Shaeky]